MSFAEHGKLSRPRARRRVRGRPASEARRGALEENMQQELRRLMHSDLALKLPLNRLAAVCGLSVRHFTRLFRSRTGVSPHRYLMQVRLSTARRLLLESDMPLHEVALACGFADQSHFTRAFSAVQTLSPAAWRRLHAPAAKR